MTVDPRLNLLLADARTGEPTLAGGMDIHAAEHGPSPEMGPDPENLWCSWADPNDLERQRWGVIAPAGPAGDELLAKIQPLIERRRAQQGGVEVKIYRVPRSAETGVAMTLAEAARWKKKHFNPSKDLDVPLPLYQLILGDLDQVPLSIQQVQSSDGLVGRIAFDEPEQYAAYVHKLLRWEEQPAQDTTGDAILYTVGDGTRETEGGHACLMAPGIEILHRWHECGKVHAAALHGKKHFSREDFWRAVRTKRPSVLFTMSHGAGAPDDGWLDAEEQRREQGALCFGRQGRISGKDLADEMFVPGGFWLMFACFGAGTPASSMYRHWLEYLAREFSVYDIQVEHVMRSLAPPARPFIAALPKAALASPRGPLAVIGHVDLAWGFSFQDFDTGVPMNRPGRFMNAIQSMLDGARVGTGFRTLSRFLSEVDSELATLYDEDRARRAGHGRSGDRTARTPGPDPTARIHSRNRERLARRGYLWMLRQDLAGYVLLGDPAARLPLARPGAEVAATSWVGPISDELKRLEIAISKVLSEQFVLDEVAYDLGIAAEKLERLVEIYRQAGRAALARQM